MTQQINLNTFDLADEDIRRQLDFEEKTRIAGETAFRNRVEKEKARGAASVTAGGRLLVAGLTAQLADMIRDEIDRLESGAVKRKPPELRTLRILPPRDMAACALRSAVDAIPLSSRSGEPITMVTLANAVGSDIADEYTAREFRKQARPLFDAVVRRVSERTSNVKVRTRELLRAFHSLPEAEAFETLDRIERHRLGIWIVTALETLGLVSFNTARRGTKAKKYAGLTPAAVDLLTKAEDRAAILHPERQPTVIPPKPWEQDTGGGYYIPSRNQRLIRARFPTNGVRAVSDEDMPAVFAALNYLQQVPWRINRRVLEVVQRMREANIADAGFPASSLEAVPARPHDIDTNEEARRAWRSEARAVHERNASSVGKILDTDKTILVAAGLADQPAIYFPKFMDFRGRVYDTPNYLKPQGTDLSKGLLEFANAKPLGETGLYWLAVHGANCAGQDKIPFDARVQWVETNEDRILAAAADPFAERFWMDADAPFAFLAFCFEWAGAIAEGPAYLSRIPVAMDGSCNGLQHFSAILRDPVGGAAVNLLPADRPQDIYTEVMLQVVRLLEEKAAQGEPTAQRWLPLMKRSVVKRPVMTLPYGATRTGFAGQIMDDTLRPLEKAGTCPFEDPFAAAQYLGALVWEATGQVVIAARQAMDWLQEVARIAASAGIALEWETPSGFVVRQDYRKTTTREVKLLCAGRRVAVQIADEWEDKLDSRKMALSIAPNFVHSLDASHMIRAAREAVRRVGPSIHLSMVHDSYACHAADCEALRVVIRQSFVEMYTEGCPLQSFADQIAEQLPPEQAAQIPPVPERGTLEISDVLNSLYFFS